MIHIDPFAPADNPQHPANWQLSKTATPPSIPAEAMTPWIALPDQPVAQDNPDASVIGAGRWAEYAGLLAQFGTSDEGEYWSEHDSDHWPDDAPMPTLVELRERQRSAGQSGTDEAQESDPVATATPEQKDAAQELADKLKALEQAGL